MERTLCFILRLNVLAGSYLVAALLRTIIVGATVGGSSGGLTSVAVDVRGSQSKEHLLAVLWLEWFVFGDDGVHQMCASNQKRVHWSLCLVLEKAVTIFDPPTRGLRAGDSTGFVTSRIYFKSVKDLRVRLCSALSGLFFSSFISPLEAQARLRRRRCFPPISGFFIDRLTLPKSSG